MPLGKGKDLESNAEIQQQQLQQITGNFPEPRLDIDDGNQATADLHAREDLLLEHYSLVDGQPGTIRIPIERAMELIAQQRGAAGGEARRRLRTTLRTRRRRRSSAADGRLCAHRL